MMLLELLRTVSLVGPWGFPYLLQSTACLVDTARPYNASYRIPFRSVSKEKTGMGRVTVIFMSLIRSLVLFGLFRRFSGFLTVKSDRKNFGRCKNNGIVQRPLVQIFPLFQEKPVIMDTIKLMDEKFSLLLIRRSLVRVQQGEPNENPFTKVDGFLFALFMKERIFK